MQEKKYLEGNLQNLVNILQKEKYLKINTSACFRKLEREEKNLKQAEKKKKRRMKAEIIETENRKQQRKSTRPKLDSLKRSIILITSALAN